MDRLRKLALLLTLLPAAASAAPPESAPRSPKVDPWVVQALARGPAEFLVLLEQQADLAPAARLATRPQKGGFVVARLREVAERTQGPLLEWLQARGIEHRSFWIANMVWVRGDGSVVDEVAARADVRHIFANPQVRLAEPVAREEAAAAPALIEWGVAKVRAPEMWNAGFTGQGIVVGGQDTGYQWDHPALKSQYRGWNGSSADHNYNWHDAIHSGGGSCGANSPEPCDDYGHGTHTMGTMVGDDGAGNQIGVAPGARWMGCRNMDVGVGTPTSYAECFQWFIAPTDLGGANPDPTKAPDVINDSWTCPSSEGCTDPLVLHAVVAATRAAGIVVVASAGNSGPSCSTVSEPPAIYDESFTVGATDSSDVIADFSSRGPVTVDGSGRLKPDVSAPGVSVRSSVPGGGYEIMSGTSMAGPHVVGVTALLLSAFPSVVGHVGTLEALVTGGALARTSTETCGGVSGSQVPNNTYGWGRADAFGSFVAGQADLAVDLSAPVVVLVGQEITYSIAVSNLGPATASSVLVSDTLPPGVVILSTSSTHGSCGQGGGQVNCLLGNLAPAGTAGVTIKVMTATPADLVDFVAVSSNTPDLAVANNSDTAATTVTVCPSAAPVITAPWSVPPSTAGLAASIPSAAGHTFTWTVTGGALTAGQGTSQIAFTSGSAGTTTGLAVVDEVLGCTSPAGQYLVQADFLDVPPSHLFHDFVATVARDGVTAGCGGGNYCPDGEVTRAQMSVFLLRARHGRDYLPPPATGTVFADVAAADFAAGWIEQLSAEQITGGCGGGRFCPGASVTRATMAVLVLRAREGPGYTPPPAVGVFNDVAAGDFAADWIEELARRGVVAGCGGGSYCPGLPVSRGQMAVFLSRTFEALAPPARPLR